MNPSSHQHPLAQSFERAQALSDYLKVSHGTPEGDGWLAAHSVFADGERFDALKQGVQARLKTRSANIVASSLLQSYQWPVVASAVACFLLDRRVPDLDVAAIRLHLNDEGEVDAIAYTGGRFVALGDDPAAGHPDAVVVASGDELRNALRAGIEAHLGLTIDQLCERLRSKRRGLWLNVADSCAGTLAWLMQEQNPAAGATRIEAEVDRLVHAPGSPLDTPKIALIELSGLDGSHVFLDRATCCYWYKTEGGDYCATCPHRTPADRTEQLLKHLAEAHNQPADA